MWAAQHDRETRLEREKQDKRKQRGTEKGHKAVSHDGETQETSRERKEKSPKAVKIKPAK